MGKANRQRRAAKARKRACQYREPSGAEKFEHGPRQEVRFATVADGFMAAVYATYQGADAAACDAVERLAAHGDGATVALEIAGVLERRVRDLWEHGWQPTDLSRSVRRECGKVEAALAGWVIASEGGGREELGARVAPGWMAQLREISAVVRPVVKAGTSARSAVTRPTWPETRDLPAEAGTALPPSRA